jgi:protein-glucosylgalactosylhydroxylysine glucosidase
VGNGEFAFTVDVTGMQTLYDERARAPLCTMSQWGWHSSPAGPGGRGYSLDDLEMTAYDYNGRKVSYAAVAKKGDEDVYAWLRENPHRLNLGRIALAWRGSEIPEREISEVDQVLRLYEGVIESAFRVRGVEVRVRTACHSAMDAVAFEAESSAFADGTLSAFIAFPYGSPGKSASDWTKEGAHETRVEEAAPSSMLIRRLLDGDGYSVALSGGEGTTFVREEPHRVSIRAAGGRLSFSVAFSPARPEAASTASPAEIMASSVRGWRYFWESGAAVELADSSDARAPELERRLVLSQYLIRVNCCGSLPPQETGLLCNSWYGKFHLEMHPWHCGHLPLWGRGNLLERSLAWYASILPAARTNAARNGFSGARWPKMVAFDGREGPSRIGTLLAWQQPHTLFFLEWLRAAEGEAPLLERYWELIRDTADFMVDFAAREEASGLRHLLPPLMPAQEIHDPLMTLDPVLELEQWRTGLKIASRFADRLGKPHGAWGAAAAEIAMPQMKGGIYPPHANCRGAFEEYGKDHPSMLGALGFLPGEGVDAASMARTMDAVLECWNFDSMWGWDFPLMAMTCARLGRPGQALDILLMDVQKNSCLANGHNDQGPGTDLPAYLPGNGGLLLAMALMAAGYPGSGDAPGFPEDGRWKASHEGLKGFPY